MCDLVGGEVPEKCKRLADTRSINEQGPEMKTGAAVNGKKIEKIPATIQVGDFVVTY